MSWSYDEAFKRNLGLISPTEQERLRNLRVAIAGLGGVGGIHLVTLARLGIGRFTIADPDRFEVANTNRQYGAVADAMGRSKAEVMAEVARSINPHVQLTVMPEAVTKDNVDKFLAGADVFLDGIDAFDLETRRVVFRRAAEKGLFAVTAGPIGFSAASLVFDPKGLSFDRYFDIDDTMDAVDRFAAFLVGLVPKATHRDYLDVRYVDVEKHTGPSAGLACQLAAGVAAAEIVKIALGRGRVRGVPYFQQFDAYHQRLAQGRLLGGNRHPWQRFKRWLLARTLRARLNKKPSVADQTPAPGVL